MPFRHPAFFFCAYHLDERIRVELAAFFYFMKANPHF